MDFLSNDGLYVNGNEFYEIKKAYLESAVIAAQDGALYVVSLPIIEDSYKLSWRNKYKVNDYRNALKIAKEINDMYQEISDIKTLSETARDIDKNIANAFLGDFRWDLKKAYEDTLADHSEVDIGVALALKIKDSDWDGRFSRTNKNWANEFLDAAQVGQKVAKHVSHCKEHSVLLNAFTDIARDNLAKRSLQITNSAEQDEEEEVVLQASLGRR